MTFSVKHVSNLEFFFVFFFLKTLLVLGSNKAKQLLGDAEALTSLLNSSCAQTLSVTKGRKSVSIAARALQTKQALCLLRFVQVFVVLLKKLDCANAIRGGTLAAWCRVGVNPNAAAKLQAFVAIFSG